VQRRAQRSPSIGSALLATLEATIVGWVEQTHIGLPIERYFNDGACASLNFAVNVLQSKTPYAFSINVSILCS